MCISILLRDTTPYNCILIVPIFIYKMSNSEKDQGVTSERYNHQGPILDGMASVERDGKWGFINEAGEEVIPCIYDEVWAFSRGLVRVQLKGKWGFINNEGEEIIPCIFDYMGFMDEVGVATVELNGKYGYYNKDGQEVVPCIYDSAHDFCEGLALVMKNDLFGFINPTGKEVIPCKYQCANDFSDDYTMVWNDDNWGIIDKTGNEVIPCIFEDIDDSAYNLHLDSNYPLFKDFIDYCEKTLDFSQPAPPGYKSAPICALDSVFSIGVKYGSVKNVVNRFLHWLGDLPMETEITTSEVLDRIGHLTDTELSGLLNNFQRTDTHDNSILKSEAFMLFLQVMQRFNVETCEDIARMVDDQEFQSTIKSIRGQSSGLTLEYLFILARIESYVKVDRHITRFAQMATGKIDLTKEQIINLVRTASKYMAYQNHNGMNARWLDHLIWTYQSSLGKN